MKIPVDGVDLFTLTDTQKQVIKNDVLEEIFNDDMKRRLQWVLIHKYEQCFEALKKEWEPKLAANGIKAIPTDKDELAQLIFSQPNYKNRSARETS
jgi:hypothetical protein